MIFDLFVITREFSTRQSSSSSKAVRPVWLRYPIPAAIFARGKSIMIPDFSRTPPSLNDRTKRSEASALRSQAVAKGLMVLPWQLLRAYCCTPLVEPCSPPLFLTLRPLLAPRSLHGIFICMCCRYARLARAHARYASPNVRARDAFVRVVHLCIYASGTKPLDMFGAMSWL